MPPPLSHLLLPLIPSHTSPACCRPATGQLQLYREAREELSMLHFTSTVAYGTPSYLPPLSKRTTFSTTMAASLLPPVLVASLDACSTTVPRARRLERLVRNRPSQPCTQHKASERLPRRVHPHRPSLPRDSDRRSTVSSSIAKVTAFWPAPTP